MLHDSKTEIQLLEDLHDIVRKIEKAKKKPRKPLVTFAPTLPEPKTRKPKPLAHAKKERSDKGQHHRNTSATQKHLLHCVDLRPGRSATLLAVETAQLSVQGAKGIRKSIDRLVARGFLHLDRAGLLRLAVPLSAMPETVAALAH